MKSIASMISAPRWFLVFLLLNTVGAQVTATASSVAAPLVAASNVTDIPVYNATILGTPNDTSVQFIPDASECDYTSGDDLYCFPYDNAFVTMTGWTRFFYNRYYGLINNSGLVDITMYFAANDAPAASWIGVENTGNVPINVNISWFTSTLPATATYSAADPYYFYVRPNSAVYNAYPTGSSVGPTFYAVQTPVQKLQVPLSTTAAIQTSPAGPSGTATTSTGSPLGSTSGVSAQAAGNRGSGLSGGAIAGIVIAAIALFLALVLLGIIILLLMRRRRYMEEVAANAAANQEKTGRESVIPGNLFTQSELFAAGLLPPRRSVPDASGRPSMDQTDSSGSMPMVINQTPFTRNPEIQAITGIIRPARARVLSTASLTPRASS